MTATTFSAQHQALTVNFPAFVFRELRKGGFKAEALLRGTGLTEEHFRDANFRVEFSEFRRFILNAIETTGDPHLGPRLSLNFEPQYVGQVAYAAMNSAHLAKGLEVFVKFSRLAFPAIEFTMQTEGSQLRSGEAEVCFQLRLELQDIAYFVNSSVLFGLDSFLNNMLRMPRVALRGELTISEPDGWAEFSKEVEHIPVRFEATKNRIIFPANLLDRSLPGADPINHHQLVSLCERFLAEKKSGSTPVSQVVSFLESENNIGASLSETAAALGYSERSLRRHLERSGDSYRKLVERLQERRARDMLANTSQPIHIIAHTLGYETASNFARSFKRWTGETPKAFRDERRTSPNAGQK